MPAFSEENVWVDDESGTVNGLASDGVDLTGVEGSAAILEDMAQQLLEDVETFQEDSSNSTTDEDAVDLIEIGDEFEDTDSGIVVEENQEIADTAEEFVQDYSMQDLVVLDEEDGDDEDLIVEESPEETSIQYTDEEAEDTIHYEIEAERLAAADEEDFTYLPLNGSFAEITGYNGTSTSVEIPATIGVYTVQKIGDNAFAKTDIVSVKLPSTVETMGKGVFKNCTSLTEVIYSENLKTLGANCFEGCTALEDPNLPEGLETIGEYAFYGCTGLTKVQLPDTVKTISYRAFLNCSNLEELTYPRSLTTVGSEVYRNDTKLTEMTVPEGVTVLATGAFRDHAYLEKVNLPEGLKQIGNAAFDGAVSLAEIDLPEGLTKIGEYAFNGCTLLTQLRIPDSVEVISYRALNGCSGLETVNYPKSLTSSGSEIFRGCQKLEKITVPEGVTQLPANVFNGASYLKEILLPESLTTIGNAALESCSRLAKIDLPQNLVSVGEYAFNACTGLTTLEIPDGVTKIGYRALYNCSGLKTVNYPRSLTSTGSGIFSGCSSLRRIEVPEGITVIPQNAFAGASYLRTIILPESLTEIGNNAFNGCSSLILLQIPESVVKIGEYAFGSCTGLKRARIPSGVTALVYRVFDNCSALQAVWIGEQVTSIGNETFRGCPSDMVVHGVEGSYAQTWAEGKGYAFSAEDIAVTIVTITGRVVREETDGTGEESVGTNGLAGVQVLVYDLDENRLLERLTTDESGEWFFDEGEPGKRYKISFADADYRFEPEYVLAQPQTGSGNVTDGVLNTGDVQAIRKYEEVEETDSSLFEYSIVSGDQIQITKFTGDLETVSVPEKIGDYTVIRIGNGVFQNNSTLKRVRIPATVKELGNNAFKNCSRLAVVQLSGGLVQIGNAAFESCTALEDLNLPEGLETIGEYAFDGCTGLTKVQLPDTVKTISYRAFLNCSNLEELTYPRSLTTVGSEVYRNDTKLTEMTVPEGVTVLATGAFRDHAYLEKVNLPEGLKQIGNAAFDGAVSLAEIDLPEGLTKIGEYAFNGCTLLTQLRIPDSVEVISYRALNGCSGLETVNYPKSLTSSGSEIFRGCQKLEKITVPEGVTQLPANVFNGASCLDEILLPEGLTTIGNAAFEGCSGLTKIDLPQSLESIGEYSFSACTGLNTLDIPDSVTSVGYRALYNCSLLQAVNYPKNVTKLGSDVFLGCVSLKMIEVPEGVTSLPANAFNGASNLRNIILPGTLKQVGNAAFQSCKGMPSIDLPSGLESLGEYALAGCDGLINIVIPGEVHKLVYRTFANNINLKQVQILGGVEEIGNEAFLNNAKLTDIYIPATVNVIHENAFKGCGEFTIHCSRGSVASVYAISHSIPVEFYDEQDNTNTLVDPDVSSYDLSVANALSNGYIYGSLKYSLKEGEALPGDAVLRVFFPQNTQLLANTVTLNGKPEEEYTFADGILSVKAVDTQGSMSFCLKPEVQKRYDSYAELSYTADGSKHSDMIGMVSEKIPLLSIEADDIMTSKTITFSGSAPVSTEVKIYLDGDYKTTIQSFKNGRYSGALTIEDAQNGLYYELTAEITDANGQSFTAEDDFCYMEGVPVLTTFDMYYNNHSSAKLNLLNTPGGAPVSFNPAYPFTFVVKFENDDAVQNVAVQSNKNGVIKSLEAKYDAATETYVASGYFDGTTGYVPGELSVAYNTDIENTVLTQDVFDVNAEKVLTGMMRSATAQVTGTTEDGSQVVTANFADVGSSFLDRKKIEVALKSYDKYNETKYHAITDGLSMYDIWLNTSSDNYFMTVLDNFIDDPVDGSPGVLILVGKTLDNEVTKYFLKYGEAGYSDTLLTGTAIVGKALKTVGKIGGTVVDTSKMRKDVLANSNYTAEQKKALLGEIDTYENTAIAFYLVIGACGIALAAGSGGAGLYVAYLIADYVGAALLDEWKKSLQSGNTPLKWIIDPSGYVYEGVLENRLEDVRATIYYLDDTGGPALWDAESYLQQNPLLTDVDGIYAWDVPEGQWQICFEKAGYETVYSDYYMVPPVHTDILIEMVPLEAPGVAGIYLYENYMDVEFSQYMEAAGLEGVIIKDSANTVIPATITYLDYGTNADGDTLVKAARYSYSDGQTVSDGEECTVSIPQMVNGAGSAMTGQTQKVKEKEELSLILPDTAQIYTTETEQIAGQIVNYTGAEQISASLDAEGCAEITSITQPDENGNFTISVNGMLTGTRNLVVTIDQTMIRKSVQIAVSAQSSEKHTHEWELVEETEPSCSKEGVRVFRCAICQKERQEAVPKLAHEWELVEETEPSCSKEGVRVFRCTMCQEEREETVPKLAHKSVTDAAVAATCAASGLTQGSHCEVCGETLIKQQIIPKTGNHQYSSWKTVKKATALRAGSKKRTCSVCGNVESKTIAKLKASVKLNKTKLTLKKKGKKATLKIKSKTYGDAILKWKSTNKKVATVSKKGVVTAKKKGKCTIILYMKSGATAKCKVTVKK